MITFKEFRQKLQEDSIQEQYLDIMEGISIEGETLKFDYSHPAGLLNKLGKHIGQQKFVPFIQNSNEFGKQKIYSVYNKGNAEHPTEIFKALKKQSHVAVSDTDYFEFIKRTAIFMADKIVRQEKIDVIVTPKSSSNILNDLIMELKPRLSHIKFLPEVYVKPADISKITIDYNHPKITPSIISSLEGTLKRAREDNSFQMKKVSKANAKFILNFIEPSKDIHLASLIKSRVAVLDDLLSSGATISRIIEDVRKIKQEVDDDSEVIGITIFKAN